MKHTNTRESCASHYFQDESPFTLEGLQLWSRRYRRETAASAAANALRPLTAAEIALIELFGDEAEDDVRNGRALSLQR